MQAWLLRKFVVERWVGTKFAMLAVIARVALEARWWEQPGAAQEQPQSSAEPQSHRAA